MNQPNAEELAHEVIELEKNESSILANQKESQKQRIHDAMLREKIRRDYQDLLKRLDQLTKEKRRLEASQISTAAVSNQ